jgi:hypothetical protein
MFDALVAAFRHKRQHDEMMFAQLTAAVVNYSMRGPEKPVKATDYLFTKLDSDPKAPKKRTKQQIANELRAVLMQAFQRIGAVPQPHGTVDS